MYIFLNMRSLQIIFVTKTGKCLVQHRSSLTGSRHKQTDTKRQPQKQPITTLDRGWSFSSQLDMFANHVVLMTSHKICVYSLNIQCWEKNRIIWRILTQFVLIWGIMKPFCLIWRIITSSCPIWRIDIPSFPIWRIVTPDQSGYEIRK